MVKHFLLTIFLFFSTVVLMANSGDLYFNGVPAAKDTLYHRMYVSFYQEKDSRPPFAVNLEWDKTMPLADALWDGEELGLDRTLTLDNIRTPHHLTYVNGEGKREEWEIIFTPFAVVELNLDHLDDLKNEAPGHGRIRILDAQHRTNGTTDFSTPLEAWYRGATARQFPKKSFSLAFVDENGEELDANVLNIRPDDKWILDAMAIDLSLMRNRLCFDLWNLIDEEKFNDRMLRNGTKGYHVEVLLNGVYNGVYCMSDKINRKLLGLKKTNGSNAGSELRGRLYKCKTGDTPTHFLQMPEESYPTDGEKWGDWFLKYPSENKYADTYDPLIELIGFTDAVKTDSVYVDDHLYDYFYKNNVTDFSVFGFAAMWLDNMMHNSYLSFYNAQIDRRVWITPWDMDGSFGRDGIGMKCNWLSKPKYVFQRTEPFCTLFRNPESKFSKAMAYRWRELRTNVLSIENVTHYIDSYAQLLDESGAWTRECKRWNGILNDLKDNPYEEAEYMKQWYARNFNHLNKMFEGIITGIHEVEMNDGQETGNPRVYTLDGREVHIDLQSSSCPKGVYIVNGKKVIR